MPGWRIMFLYFEILINYIEEDLVLEIFSNILR